MTTRLRMVVLLLGLFLLIALIGCNQDNRTKVFKDNNLRNLVPQRWWETVPSICRVSLRSRRNRPALPIRDEAKLSSVLDDMRAQGIYAIEIFAPSEGGIAYGGLATKNHFRIDPELGTMDDFRRLVQLCHSKGLPIIVFKNIGYFDYDAPDWIEACKDKKANKDSEKVRWFCWADSADAPLPAPDNHHFFNKNEAEKRETWGWQYSDLAGCYYWARWQSILEDGSYIGLPQNNWTSEEWPKVTKEIVRFWMDTGIDGMVIDAPYCYPGLTWEKNNRYITDVVVSYGNVFCQPEASGAYNRDPIAWITEGGYNCVQDYGLGFRRFKSSNVIANAINSGDPRTIERALRDYHDRVVAAGGVLYYAPESHARFDEAEKQRLSVATIACVGDMISLRYGLENDLQTNPEIRWIIEKKAEHPALHQLSTRRKLPTSADNKHYAFLRTAADGSERMMVVLNFQATPQTVEVELSGVATAGLVELKTGESYERKTIFNVKLPAYGYRFYQVLPAERLH